MKVEDLLKVLRDAGLEEDEIANLLKDALASLKGPAEDTPTPEEEEKKAGELLGVDF